MQITYQKRDGDIIQKHRKTMLPYKIGDTTSMGWKVLNIEYGYKDKFYSECEYNRLMYKNKQDYIKKKHTIELLSKELKTLLYYFIMIIIYNLISILIRI